MNKYLEFKDDKSSKFWKIEVMDHTFTVTFGKIGTTGQTQTKEFESKERCIKEAEKLLNEKLKKGYAEQSASGIKEESEKKSKKTEQVIKFKFENCGKKLSEEDFAYVEKIIDQKLPDDLRKLYEKFNGGIVEGEKNVFVMETDDDFIEAEVQLFMPMRYKLSKDDSLLEEDYVFNVKEKKFFKKHFIPFAFDGGGFPYCYNTKNGKIYLCNLDNFEDPDGWMDYVAPSLASFINGMITEDEAFG